MAAITLTSLIPNNKVTEPTPAVLTTNDTYQSIPIAGKPAEEVLLRVVVATAGTTTTIKAGSQPLAIASGQGDLAFAALAIGTHLIGPFESGRFLQNDATLSIKAATAANVSVAAIHMPRTA